MVKYRGVLFIPLLPLFSRMVTVPSLVATARFWLSWLYTRQVTGLAGPLPRLNTLSCFRSRPERSAAVKDQAPGTPQDLFRVPSVAQPMDANWSSGDA